MPIPRFLILAVLLPFSSLLGKYSLPPMEKSVEAESTGLNVPPGFEVDLVYKVDKKNYGSWLAMAMSCAIGVPYCFGVLAIASLFVYVPGLDDPPQ